MLAALQGSLHYVDPARLPKPYATASAENGPDITARAGAPLHVARGFRVEPFATGFDRPRRIAVAPNGDVFVAESYVGRVALLRGGKRTTFATGLRQPYGIAFYPPGPAPRFVLIAHTDRVVRYPYRSGDMSLRGPGQTLMTLPGGGYRQHWTRNVAFSPKGDRMFVTVGSASNASPEPAPRASILVADPDGGKAHAYATGLRNPVGLAFQPGTSRLWAAVNERDRLGDGLVPDYATHVEAGGWYGWPYFYLGGNPDPRVPPPANARLRPGIVPDVLLEAHCAALGIAFPPSGSPFKGAFVSMHGSWNRSQRSGYKIVRLVLDAKGNATGRYEDFVWGFSTPQGRVWGRPVDVAFARDGSLLFSDDAGGTVWRVRKRVVPQTNPDVTLLTPLDQARLLVREFLALLPNLALAAITLAVAYVIARYAARLVEAVVRRANQNPTAALLIGRFAKGIVMTVGALVALSTVFPSFQARDLIQLLGISGVAVGFAFKDIFQNFLAGVIILISRPFRIGDTIAVKSYEGVVEDIQTRATMLRTADNQRIVVPNTVLFSEEVKVLTAYDNRRTEVDLGIAYSRDLEAARDAVLSAVRDVEGVQASPAPDVLVVGFTDTRATLRVRVWTKSDANLPVVRDEVARTARRAMADAGIP